MAESIVLYAIKKISIAVAGQILNVAKPLLAIRSEQVTALPTNMELIKEELELIDAFLNKIGTKECKDIVLEAWIRQVRRVAYDIEDIVDQFIYVVGESQGKGFRCRLKQIVKKPQALISLDEIAVKVEKVKNKLMELSQRRDRWIISRSDGVELLVPNCDTEKHEYIPGHGHTIDEDELVGINRTREMLTKLLHSKDHTLLIIAVWGMGGLGKSTLVNNVYEREGSKFDCHAWISVSRSFKIDEILRNILKELSEDNNVQVDAEMLNSAELRMELRKVLDRRRYLIILDDVWTASPLLEIKDLIVNEDQRSRIVITTRIDEVASIAQDGCKIKLEPLSKDDAWFLFCRKAFWKIKNQTCPPELKKWSEGIVKKCGGLPLALVVVGSLLSLRANTKAEWKRVHDQLMWEFHKNPNLSHVGKILNLSYKHLPSYLKNCFLYCAIFPDNYLLESENLIRLWIAEGFVEQRGGSTLEEVAEGYLTELVQQSMLQVVTRNKFDAICRFRVHDFVRGLAIFLAEQDNFCAIYDDAFGVMQVQSVSRRVSVLQCKNDIKSSIDPSRLRTFLAFDTSMASSSWSSFIPSNSKYLTVLDLSGLMIESISYSIGELFNLKYLCLNDTNVKSLPKSIANLHNLETLCLGGAQLLNLPHGCAKLKKLRHLLVWKMIDGTFRSFRYVSGAEPFEGMCNLKDLQTLKGVRASKGVVRKLANLTQLRSLCLSNVKSSYCAELCSSLSKMQQLSTLQMVASNEDEAFQMETLTSPPIKILELTGRLAEGTFESPLFSVHGDTLVTLWLGWSQLAENPIPRLSILSNLTTLYLTRAYSGQQLIFHAGCLPSLKNVFLLDLLQVNQIYIEEGALVNLEYLKLQGLKELRDVPNGIEFLLFIQDAHFSDMHPDFIGNLQESIEMRKLQHIHNIYF